MRCRALTRRFAPLILAGLPAPFLQADPLKFDVGPFNLEPRATVGETYNDNVLLRENNVKGDFITQFMPGLGIFTGEPNFNHASVDYLLTRNLYANQSQLDSLDHAISFQGIYDWPRLTLEGTASYLSKKALLGGEVSSESPVGYETYYDVLKLAYDLSGKTGLYGSVRYDAEEFEKNTGLIDYADVRGTLGATYHYTPKTSFFLEGYYGQVGTKPEDPRIPVGPRAYYEGTYMGLQGKLATRFTFYAKAGYEFRNFSDGTSAPGALVSEVSLSYNFNENLVANVRYHRANQTSIQFNDQTFVQDDVHASLTRKFGSEGKLETSIGVDYLVNAYDSTSKNNIIGQSLNGRTDSPIELNLDVKYHFRKWLLADCGYRFSNFDSSDSTVRKYTVNQIYLFLSMGYTKP